MKLDWSNDYRFSNNFYQPVTTTIRTIFALNSSTSPDNVCSLSGTFSNSIISYDVRKPDTSDTPKNICREGWSNWRKIGMGLHSEVRVDFPTSLTRKKNVCVVHHFVLETAMEIQLFISFSRSSLTAKSALLNADGANSKKSASPNLQKNFLTL